METARRYDPSERFDLLGSIPFVLAHLGAVVGVIFTGVSAWLLLLALGSYLIRMFGVTAGYHRYFAHRTFKTSRPFQFVLALTGTLAVQKGVLWWSAHHREHHRHSDQPEDIHSPTLRGFLWAHIGWIVCTKYDPTNLARIRDFAQFPELRWLNRYHLVPPLAAGALVWWLLGPAAFVWAGLVGTVFLWHGTFTINSLCHLFGRRRYPTTDTSRNSFLLALVTGGEGWHNNHHYFPASTRQGFFWWEIDPTYYALKALSWVGIVWDLREPPAEIVSGAHRIGTAVREDGPRAANAPVSVET